MGYEAGKDAPPSQPNRRNGTSAKRLKGQDGELPISVPRDRDGSFGAELAKKGQTRIDGMDDKIIHCPAGDCKAIFREGVVLPRFSSGLFRAMFAMEEIWNGKEIHRRFSA